MRELAAVSSNLCLYLVCQGTFSRRIQFYNCRSQRSSVASNLVEKLKYCYNHQDQHCVSTIHPTDLQERQRRF